MTRYIGGTAEEITKKMKEKDSEFTAKDRQRDKDKDMRGKVRQKWNTDRREMHTQAKTED